MVAVFGIYETEQLSGFNPDSRLGRHRLIAADLLASIDAMGEDRLRDAFFERFVDHRGAYKRTYRRRFKDFDAMLVQHLEEGPQWEGPTTVLDVSVSDGSTTVDLLEALKKLDAGGLELTATDLDTHYVVLERTRRVLPGQRRRVLVAEDGSIVQMVFPPFVFGSKTTDRSSTLPVNRAAKRLARYRSEQLVSRWRAGSSDVRAERILVTNREFRRLLEAGEGVTFQRWNILEPWTGRQHRLVRAMNVLNPSYFSFEEQKRAIAHLRSAVVEGGLLGVGSNQGPQSAVDGAIYRREGGRLVELQRLGEGNRCADALDALQAVAGRRPTSAPF